MGSKTKIEWTRGSDGSEGATWTPIRARNKVTEKVGWHCVRVSPGCEHCYSQSFNLRLGTGLPFKPGHEKDIDIFLDEEMLRAPLQWKKPRTIFVCSMTDLFADFVKDEWLDRIFAVMALAPQHTFQCLTKRSDRMRAYLSQFDQRGRYVCSSTRHQIGPDRRDGNCLLLLHDGQVWPLANCWLGVSAEDQANADARIPDLLATPAAVRFVSYEPALGPISFRQWMTAPGDDHLWQDGGISWVIYGGESGPKARPANIAWARSALAQCKAAGVACFIKQLGRSSMMGRGDAAQPVALGAGWQVAHPGAALGTVTFRHPKGGSMEEWPPDLRVREMPAVTL
jgi:protein gp37